MKKVVIALALIVYFLAVYSAGRFVALNYAQNPQTVSAITPSKTIELNDDKLWSLIQDWRKSEGLQPYIKDQRLCDIAEDRVIDGFDNHKGLFEKYSAYPYEISENSTGGYSEKHALNKWLNSSPHRTALEKTYVYSCVATQNDYAVQIFSNF